MTSLFARVKELLHRSAGTELVGRDLLDRPSLRQQVVRGVLTLRQRGAKGADTLPRMVRVTVRVAEGSLEVVRRFLDDPTFDDEVAAELANRLVGASADALPVRLYDEPVRGTPTGVSVTEAGDEPWAWLEIEGGDRESKRVPLKASQVTYRLGRGPWHGEEGSVPNDVELPLEEDFVSRRAALLVRGGSAYLLEALDQQEHLTVVRGEGERIHPYRVRGGRVRLRHDDVIELDNGGDGRAPGRERRSLRLRLVRDR